MELQCFLSLEPTSGYGRAVLTNVGSKVALGRITSIHLVVCSLVVWLFGSLVLWLWCCGCRVCCVCCGCYGVVVVNVVVVVVWLCFFVVRGCACLGEEARRGECHEGDSMIPSSPTTLFA